MKYKFFEDIAIADIAFEAYGKDLNELFTNAALAVSEAMVKLKTVDHKTSEVIEIKEKDIDMLLFDFLAEIVLLKDTESLLFSKYDIEIEEKDGYKLKCVAFGEKIDMKKHELGVDVKAITMHMFEVKKEEGKWKAMVVLDI